MGNTFDEVPTTKLIKLQFTHSRMRSTRRHNRHVLRALRRNQRQVVACQAVIASAGIIAVIGFSKLLLVAFG